MLLYLCYSLVVLLIACLNVEYSAALYTAHDHVNILTDSNFTDFVIGGHRDGTKLQIVHFFAHWCPYCQAFSPTFKRFLASCQHWSHLIDFSVMSCSVDNEWDLLCDQYLIDGVPRFRLFWFSPNSTDLGIDIVLNPYDETKIRVSVIQSISKYWKRGNIPSNWPRFLPLSAADFNGALAEASKVTTAVLIEGEGSLLGRELMMHFGARRDGLCIYRVVYRPWVESDQQTWPQLIPNIHSIERPFLLLLGKGRQSQHFVYFHNFNPAIDDFSYFAKVIDQNS